VQHLALQVAKIDDIKIDQSNPANAGRGQVQAERGAESTGADEEDARGFESFLPVQGDLGHDEVTAIARDLGCRQGEALRAGSERIENGVHDRCPLLVSWSFIWRGMGSGVALVLRPSPPMAMGGLP